MAIVQRRPAASAVTHMHELSLVRNLVERAIEVARAKGVNRIGRIVVGIGQMNGVEPEEISECFEFLRGEYPEIREASLETRIVDAEVLCHNCGQRFGPEHGGRCPNCSSYDIEMLSGDEMLLLDVG